MDMQNKVHSIVEPVTGEGCAAEMPDYEAFITGIEAREIAYSGEGIFNAEDFEEERSEECVS